MGRRIALKNQINKNRVMDIERIDWWGIETIVHIVEVQVEKVFTQYYKEKHSRSTPLKLCSCGRWQIGKDGYPCVPDGCKCNL